MAGTSIDYNPEPEVTIWLSRQPEKPDWPVLTRCFTDAEHAKIQELSPRRQLEYSHSRWLLRQALAQVSGLGVDDCRPVDGRPVRSATPRGWALSLSHSHGVAACAVSNHASTVGVDIEPCVRRSDWQRIVKRWFSESEQYWLLAADSVPDFLRVWTLKEAWLKATGRGIAGNLQTLSVNASGRLQGDDQSRRRAGATGEVDGITLGVVYEVGTSGIPLPEVRWIAPPGHFDDEGTAAVAMAKVNWWTAVAVGAGGQND